MENNQQTVPMEEMAQVEFQKDIQIAILMKQLKESNQKIVMLEQLLSPSKENKSEVRVQATE